MPEQTKFGPDSPEFRQAMERMADEMRAKLEATSPAFCGISGTTTTSNATLPPLTMEGLTSTVEMFEKLYPKLRVTIGPGDSYHPIVDLLLRAGAIIDVVEFMVPGMMVYQLGDNAGIVMLDSIDMTELSSRLARLSR